jgi:hypothetical protein
MGREPVPTPPAYAQSLLRRAAALSAPGAPRGAGMRPPRDQPKHMANESVRVDCESVKTFNNGSLGSGIDEERSEMR